MSREKRFTKGAWRVVEKGRPVGHAYFEIAWSTDGELVADVVYAHADAQLMATSKELLEDLEDRYAQTKCGCGHPACRRCQEDAETERVIAKAYGEDQ